MADESIYNNNLTLDEIVFQNRNKEYGAYDLRHSYPKILTKSFLMGTAIFLVMVFTPLIYLKIQQMNARNKQEVDAKLINVLQDDKPKELPKDEPPPPPPPKVEPPKVEVIQNVVPEPKRAPKVETPPPPMTKQLESTTGLKNQEGEKQATYAPPPPPPSTGKAATVEVKPPSNEVYDTVDQSSEFPGGLDAFRGKVSSNFDTSVLSESGTVKADVSFIVERDGSITDVKATGSNSDFNAEAVRTVKSVKTKWTPGKLNGQPVRSRFRLPITMNIE